jgi:hypothetical protein
VLDQKHAIFVVQHHGADTQGHAARQPPIEVKDLPQHRLKPHSQAFHTHRNRNPLLDRFDPCATLIRLPIDGRLCGETIMAPIRQGIASISTERR